MMKKSGGFEGSGGEEERGESEKLEVAPEQLRDMLCGAQFQEALRIAAEETRRSGRETGFSIQIFEDGTHSIWEVTAGATYGMGMREEHLADIDEAVLSGVGERKEATVLGLHFHPEAEGLICPSQDDLGELFPLEGGGYAGCIAIGQAREDGTVRALLIKSEKPFVPEELQGIEDELEGAKTQEEVAAVLKRGSFASELISFEETEKGYRMVSGSPEALARFGNISVRLEKLGA